MKSKAVHPKNILWRWDGRNDDIIIAMSHETCDVQILNPSASQIFSLCNGEKSISEIVEELDSQFASAGMNIEEDVIACILELHEKGLVNLKGGDSR